MGELFYTTYAIEAITRNILTEYDPYYLNGDPQAVPIERIIEHHGLDIDYIRLTMTGDELGRMIYDDGYTTCYNDEKADYELMRVKTGDVLIEALLANDMAQNGRYRFTAAHEFGHWRLQKDLYIGTKLAAATFLTDKQSDDAREWQANYFAKSILMPTGQVKRGFHQLKTERVRDKIKSLASIFEVSQEAMRYRLSELGLI